MKKFLLKPGFEFVFALSLMVILGLPLVLLAQNQKDIEIKIENGDTTVNGKNIKELPIADRQNALMDIKHINNDNGQDAFFKRKDTTDGKTQRFMLRRRLQQNGDHQPVITENMVMKDSLGSTVNVRTGRRRPMSANQAFKYRNFDENQDRLELAERNFGGRLRGPMGTFEGKNSQNFDYVNIDNQGISTHLRFHVSEVSNDDLKKMPHVEGGKFEITDLNLVPEFSTGKTLLMFNLTAKTAAEVKLIDSEGKVLWNDKSTGGSFSKTFAMGLNGIYYLQIKQGNNIAIKRIMKEE